MFDSPDLDSAPYGDIDMAKYVRRSYCSWNDANWRSLLVQSYAHARQVEDLLLPGTSDLHLVLCTAGQAVIRRTGHGRPGRRTPPAVAAGPPGGG